MHPNFDRIFFFLSKTKGFNRGHLVAAGSVRERERSEKWNHWPSVGNNKLQSIEPSWKVILDTSDENFVKVYFDTANSTHSPSLP